MSVEPERLRPLNDIAPRARGARFVLYLCTVNRRVEFNHGLLHAAHMANTAGLPLLVYEELNSAHKAANDRLRTFLLDGVPEIAAALKKRRVGYFFRLCERRDDTPDVLQELIRHALTVITDDHPLGTSSLDVSVPYVAVDSSCIVPMSMHEKRAWGAYTIRPKIRRELPRWLKAPGSPKVNVPWSDSLLPARLLPLRTDITQEGIPRLLARCEIDHSVLPPKDIEGGKAQAGRRLRDFLDRRLFRYARDKNEPSKKATSGLSPYLHFGHISSLEVALAVMEHAAEHKLIADEFLEELIVRRELAFNFARFTPNVESLDALPDWCRRTMAKHAHDPRPVIYRHADFEYARTHDDLWNAAQKELLLRGMIHGYYRMYWGKKIIEWSETYEEALRTMIGLHDKYALDGRDPNTYTNILWCFGLHDRPWGERPIFGQLRYMSLEGMRRKTDTKAYLAEIAGLE